MIGDVASVIATSQNLETSKKLGASIADNITVHWSHEKEKERQPNGNR